MECCLLKIDQIIPILRLTKAILAIKSASTIRTESKNVPDICTIVMKTILNFEITEIVSETNKNAIK